MSEASSGIGCCIKCGHSLPTPASKFCDECGAPQMETKNCVACGKGIRSRGNFCIHCGQDQRKPVSSETKSCPQCHQELQSSAPFCDICGCNQLQPVSQQLCCFCSSPLPESSPSCPVCSAPVDPNIMNSIPLKQCVNPRCQARLMGFVPICYRCHSYQVPPQTSSSSMSASLLAPSTFSLPSCSISQSKYCATCMRIIPEPSQVCSYCQNSQPLPTPQQLMVVPQPSVAYQAPSFQAPTSQMFASVSGIPLPAQSQPFVQDSDSFPTSVSEIQRQPLVQDSDSTSASGIVFGSQSSPQMGEGLVQFQATTQQGTVHPPAVTASVHQSTSSGQFSNAYLTTLSTGTALPTTSGGIFHSVTNSNPQSSPEVEDGLEGAVQQTPELASIKSGSNSSGASENSPMAVGEEESVLPSERKDSGVLLSMDSLPTTSVVPAVISSGACSTEKVVSGDLQQVESDTCCVGAKRLQDQNFISDPSKRSRTDKKDDESNSGSVIGAKHTSKRLLISSDDFKSKGDSFAPDPSTKMSKIDKEGIREEASVEDKCDVNAINLYSEHDSSNNIIDPTLSSGTVRKETVEAATGNSSSDSVVRHLADGDEAQENDKTSPDLRSMNNSHSTDVPTKKKRTMGSQQLPDATTHPLTDSADNEDQSHQQQPRTIPSHTGSPSQHDAKNSLTDVDADSSVNPSSLATQTMSRNPQSSPKIHNPSDENDTLFIAKENPNRSSKKQGTSPSTNPPDDMSHEEDGSTVSAVEDSNGSSKSALVPFSSPEQVCSSSVDRYELCDLVLRNVSA